MSFIRRIKTGFLLGWCMLWVICPPTVAQDDTEFTAVGLSSAGGASSARGRWEQRVLRQQQPNHSAKVRKANWSPQRKPPVQTVSSAIPLQLQGAEVDVTLDPAEIDVTYDPLQAEAADVQLSGPIMESHGGCGGEPSGCGRCEAPCGGCGSCSECWWGLGRIRSEPWTRDLSVFAGVHGFKGPVDQGRNGNFGIHEGVNFGAPLGGPWGLGYQLGFNAVHSNFAGDQADSALGIRGSDRNQVFFTAGVFRRRLCGGWQWGVAFDLLHDNYYYGNTDLKQIRTETSYRLPDGLREVGYFGAYGTGGDDLIFLDRRRLGLQPTDLFAFYYRRYFSDGGDGRFWGGFSGRGDALIGAEVRVPIGGSWALENRVNYLIPRQTRGQGGGQSQESWGLTVNLVCYLGRPARCVDGSPYRPMFSVADNTTFMSDLLSVSIDDFED